MSEPSTHKFKKSISVLVLIHILIWTVIAVVLFVYQPLSWNIAIPIQLWIKQAIVLALLIISYYVNANLFVPKFLLQNRTRDFFILLILLVGFVLFINSWMDPWLHIPQLMDKAFHQHGPPHPRDHKRDFSVLMLTMTSLVLGISTSVTAIQKWQSDQQRRQELEQEKTTSELSFLKAQINPHFFFNTLNNIYALTVVDVEASREAIHKLSRMMRYLLYETQQDTTFLSKEIGFIKDYIELMKLRLTDRVTLQFIYPENLKDEQIAPMLFLPFVENAFKHGISSTDPSNITIVITQNDGLLSMNVSNTIFDDPQVQVEGDSGIGLNNTRRRLDLIYPNHHTLIIERTADDQYNVKLTLNLS
ncbi:sensor histidine kinase [Mucilaginibacter jinjuensis]|uniref:Histidine kinase n=1 Tax=Mucilaginibacter jinjuensis TaxID=1176721 RepID=A0ABY7TBA7_9SPHI|nr:histidine kinase [Mucilaginibacter jinjuensis]WCT13221.1 histidine kinase [Mucilaginibacter jinjuensis]